MNSLLVVVKSHLFPQFALAGVTGGRGEFAVVNRGWAGTVPGRDGGSQTRWAGNPSEARWRRQLLTTLTVTHNRYLVEAPGKGWAHDVRGIR